MTIHFVDVSLHDRNRRGAPLDWNAIKAAGLGSIMMARVSYGDPQTFNPPSPFAKELIQGAKLAGYTTRIGYHNLINGDPASTRRQVNYLRNMLDVTGATSGMVDVELYQELVNNGRWPRWTDVARFHDIWYSLDPRPLVWYIPRWVWEGKLGKPDLRVLRGLLTSSNYPDGDGTYIQIYRNSAGDAGPGWKPYGNRTPDIWQYTSDGNVPGNGTKTDCNAFRGSVADFARLVGQAAPIPPVTPPKPIGDPIVAKLPVLRRGMTGQHVKDMQHLILAHAVTLSGGADGDFGGGTEAAVRVFQKREAITADGVVGPVTWAHLLDVN